MSSALTPHPAGELLLRLLDGDLSPAESGALQEHLHACEPCRGELAQLRETLKDYQQFHGTVLKAAIPPPPKPWRRLDLPTAAPHSAVPWRWLAAAAALAAVFLLVRRFEHAPGVKAAELLRRAASAERTMPAHARTIRITAGRYRVDRPSRITGAAVTPSPDAVRIRQLLDSAGYSWDDPLSAEAFTRWHDRLPDPQDSVAEGGERYVIHTTATAGAISDASLTLRAADLHAVACTLRFAAETVEMTEIAAENAAPAAPAPARHAAEPGAPPAPSDGPSRAATLDDELLVVAALHRIGADLGEPVAVTRDASEVLVNVAGVSPQRQDEVRDALSGIPAVRIQVQAPGAPGSREVERRPAPQVDTADPLLSELQAASPDIADQLTDHTETLIARAYALRGLARRFPVETTARMTPTGNATLNSIVRDHVEAIAVSAATLKRLLAPVLPRTVLEPAVSGLAWQDATEPLVLDARRLDQALHPATTPSDSGSRKSSAALALGDIGERLAALRRPGIQ